MKENPKYRFTLLIFGILFTAGAFVLDIFTRGAGSFWLWSCIGLGVWGITALIAYWVIHLEWNNVLANRSNSHVDHSVSEESQIKNVTAYIFLGLAIQLSWLEMFLILYAIHSDASLSWILIPLLVASGGAFFVYMLLRFKENFHKVIVYY